MASTLVPEAATSDRAELLTWFAEHLEQAMRDAGLRLVPADAAAAEVEGGVVLHRVDAAAPHSYRRKSRAVFVVAVGAADEAPEDPLKAGYPLLLATLANLFILVVRNGRLGPGPEAYFLTLEQGSYAIPHTGDDQAFFDKVIARVAPLATSQLVIDNTFTPDLPEALWDGDEHTAMISKAGALLDALDLLPAPFPLAEFLSPQDFRHVQQLFNIGGLSYCNLSQRRDATSFWMSASGVDKSRLRTVGRDILLVTGFDQSKPAMEISVPPELKPRRVSVDAIEHHKIYREHPSVGAILHVHAWMEGIESTEINFPCGTMELADAVADLVRRAPDPGHAVIGLKNHGLTITGESLDEIFARTDGQILRQVPMS